MVIKEQDIINLITEDPWMMKVLRLARSIALPDWCICAGFIRSKVWDYLHEFDSRSSLTDVDVVYFDSRDTNEDTEKKYEKTLRELDSSIPWSVKNQARMHTKNGHVPYMSTADGLSNFPEVCTAIGASLDFNDQIHLVAPHGIDDLVSLIVRPTPFFTTIDRKEVYEKRMASKRWQETWNRLRIFDA